jgi:hypothetical protein
MPVKKPKRAKKTKKGRRVATAPVRDVIVNIQTSKPRARRQLKQVKPKRSEDLNIKIRDLEIAQGQFRQTELIKAQAKQIGILDKRLSVLTDIIDNESTKPLTEKDFMFEKDREDTPQPTPRRGGAPRGARTKERNEELRIERERKRLAKQLLEEVEGGGKLTPQTTPRKNDKLKKPKQTLKVLGELEPVKVVDIDF